MFSPLPLRIRLVQFLGMGIRTTFGLSEQADLVEICERLGFPPTSPLPTSIARRWCIARRLARGFAGDHAAIAGELLIPAVDASPEVLAAEWLAPLPAAYLRVAEVTGVPTAVVRRGWHRLRGGPGLPRSQEMLEALAFGKRRHGVGRVVCGEDVVLVG